MGGCRFRQWLPAVVDQAMKSTPPWIQHRRPKLPWHPLLTSHNELTHGLCGVNLAGVRLTVQDELLNLGLGSRLISAHLE